MELNVSKRYALSRMFLRPEGIFLVVAFIAMPVISGMLLYASIRGSIQEELVDICEHVGEHVNGALHDRLVAVGDMNSPLYEQVLAPLRLIHLTSPKIKYLFTMKEVDGNWHFIIDTMQDADVSRQVTARFPDAVASEFLEFYDYPESFLDGVRIVMAGGIDIDDDVYEDQFGKTIGCMTGIRNEGQITGILGVDYQAAELEDVVRNMQINVGAGFIVAAIFLFLFFRHLREYLQLKQERIYELSQLSSLDSLTELLNRRAFFLSATRLLDKARAHSYKGAAILDIDHFKDVNDRHGHHVGDLALKHFSKLLNHCCNTRKFIVGRIGGEEFAIFSATTDEHDLRDALMDFQSLLAKSPVETGDVTFPLTVSIGYVVQTGRDVDIPAALELADKAVYESKDQGRDRITLYTPE